MSSKTTCTNDLFLGRMHFTLTVKDSQSAVALKGNCKGTVFIRPIPPVMAFIQCSLKCRQPVDMDLIVMLAKHCCSALFYSSSLFEGLECLGGTDISRPVV